MANIEYIAIPHENITLLNANYQEYLMIQIDVAAIWQTLQNYTHTYIQILNKVPVLINGKNQWIQSEIGESFKVSEIINKQVSIQAVMPQPINNDLKNQITALGSLLYYNQLEEERNISS